jgi:hypothetical protein
MLYLISTRVTPSLLSHLKPTRLTCAGTAIAPSCSLRLSKKFSEERRELGAKWCEAESLEGEGEGAGAGAEETRGPAEGLGENEFKPREASWLRSRTSTDSTWRFLRRSWNLWRERAGVWSP